MKETYKRDKAYFYLIKIFKNIKKIIFLKH